MDKDAAWLAFLFTVQYLRNLVDSIVGCWENKLGNALGKQSQQPDLKTISNNAPKNEYQNIEVRLSAYFP